MFPDEQSPYAAEGTVAHDLAEAILRHKLEGKKAPKLDDYSTEMVEAVNRYVDICEEKVNEARARSSDAEAMIEARLDFSRWVPEGFGTGDMVIVADGILEVIDLKYGKGVPVSAIENTQMRLYALGAYDASELLMKWHLRNCLIGAKTSNQLHNVPLTVRAVARLVITVTSVKHGTPAGH